MKEKPIKQKKTYRCFFCKDILVDRFDFYWLCPPLYICPSCTEKKRQKSPAWWSVLDVARLILSALLFASILIVPFYLIHHFLIPVDDTPIDWDRIPVIGVLIESTGVIVSVLILIAKIFFYTVGACIVAYLPTVFLLMLFVERLPLSDFLTPMNKSKKPHPYMRAMKDTAVKLKFIPCGDYQMTNSFACCCADYSIWISSHGNMLCVIEVSSFLGFYLKKTLIYSWFANDKVYESSDHVFERSMSGNIITKTLINADLLELVKGQKQHIAAEVCQPKRFTKDTAINDFYAIELQRGARLAADGLVYFCDTDKTTLKHTLKGAYLSAFINNFKKDPVFDTQSERFNIKRPAHPKYVSSNEGSIARRCNPAMKISWNVPKEHHKRMVKKELIAGWKSGYMAKMMMFQGLVFLMMLYAAKMKGNGNLDEPWMVLLLGITIIGAPIIFSVVIMYSPTTVAVEPKGIDACLSSRNLIPYSKISDISILRHDTGQHVLRFFAKGKQRLYIVSEEVEIEHLRELLSEYSGQDVEVEDAVLKG